MQSRFKAAALVAVLAALSVAITGCGQLNVLQARKAIKEAHILYAQQDWKRAADKYEETINYDPDQNQAYFYLANSYDNLFKPSRKGDPVNDGYLTKAVEFYHKASQLSPDPKTRTLALQYLVAAYGADKLNDPGQAEPLVQEMIKLEPTEPSELLRPREDVRGRRNVRQDRGDAAQGQGGAAERPGRVHAARPLLQRHGRVRQDDGCALRPRQGRAQQSRGVLHDLGLLLGQGEQGLPVEGARQAKFLGQGLEAANKALELNPNYIDALVYKGLILRSQALVEKEPSKQKALIAEATQLRDKAEALRKKKAAGEAVK